MVTAASGVWPGQQTGSHTAVAGPLPVAEAARRFEEAGPRGLAHVPLRTGPVGGMQRDPCVHTEVETVF